MWQQLIQRALGTSSSRAGDRPRDLSGAATVRISNEARAVVQAECLALFHIRRGLMFKANGAGAQIWEALAKEVPVPLVAGQLALRYGIPEQQAANDVARFIGELRSAGLVTGVGA